MTRSTGQSAREQKVYSVQCKVSSGSVTVCCRFLARKQHGGEEKKKRGREKEWRASRTAAARPTCKLNQLRSMTEWLAWRKKTICEYQKRLSLSCTTVNWGTTSVCALLKWLLNTETTCLTLQSRWKCRRNALKNIFFFERGQKTGRLEGNDSGSRGADCEPAGVRLRVNILW